MDSQEKLLRVIRDADVSSTAPFPKQYEKRTTARVILWDEAQCIALMHVGKKNYHKLPGGGLEAGESIQDALHREVLEEVGCKTQNIQPIGKIEEYRAQMAWHQISYGFTAHIKGEKGAPAFDEWEIADNCRITWLPAKEALALLHTEANHPDYEGRFINLRERLFLETAFSAQK